MYGHWCIIKASGGGGDMTMKLDGAGVETLNVER